MKLSLDEIWAAGQQRKLEQQREGIAQMADEIERKKADDWQPPFDEHEYVPEEVKPLDWWVTEQIAKENAKHKLAEEPREPDSTGYTIYIEETD
jgi:hypothetical protein